VSIIHISASEGLTKELIPFAHSFWNMNGLSFIKIILSAILILSLIISSVQIGNGMRCKEDEVLVQKPGRSIKSNGCSKPDFLEVKGEEDFTHCCDRHDACYAMCGASKDYCDHDFKSCMIKLCSTNFPHNPDCKQAASMYAMGTQLFGSTGFDALQRDHCQCLHRSGVLQHYIDLVDSFYSKHVDPEHRKDAKTIIRNSKHAVNSGSVDNPVYESIYKIYYELYKKYDQAIEHIEKRVGKIIEKPKLQVEL
jgi:hypothetical protein